MIGLVIHFRTKEDILIYYDFDHIFIYYSYKVNSLFMFYIRTNGCNKGIDAQSGA